MSFHLLLEGWQGSSIPDRGRKVILPTRSDEENVLESDFEPLCDGTRGIVCYFWCLFQSTSVVKLSAHFDFATV